MNTMQKIVVSVVLFASGALDEAATDANYATAKKALSEKLAKDYTSVSKEINEFLINNPKVTSLPLPNLVRALWEERLDAGIYKGVERTAKDAAFNELEELVSSFVKSNKEQFHTGRRSGISFRFAVGEHEMDDNGTPKVDADGTPVQKYRISETDWNKLITPKEKDTSDAAPESTSTPATQAA